MEIIKLSDISFSYLDNKEIKTHFFNHLNFSVREGEFISILGPNGSGKSTLLKIIANILEPLSGNVQLYEKEYLKYSRKEFAREMAFVPQSSNTNFPYSIFEIVMMGRSPYLNFLGAENSEDLEFVYETLELLEILHLIKKGINEVSGGEAQRALIARALVQDPKILLLDEPNAHLDIKHQLSIFDLLYKLNLDKKLTVITISHDLNLANFYSSRAILMKEGNIVYDSEPKEVLTVTNIKEIFGVESKILLDEGAKNNYISFIH